jgi:hypothetical protein
MTEKVLWRTAGRELTVEMFASEERRRDYYDNLMKCGVCHQKIVEDEEFGMIPFKQEGNNEACILIHKKCYEKAFKED